MKTKLSMLLLATLVLAACAGGSSALEEAEESFGAPAAPLTSSAESLAVNPNLLPSGCVASGPGIARPNSSVLEARTDGQAYLDASQRLEGWQTQFDCTDNPRLIVNVVNTYATLEGAAISLSRTWHSEVWSRIDAGELEQLPDMPGLGDLQLVFQDANGTVGVEFIYRNVYLFLTGTADEGIDNYDFFADLAQTYLAQIQLSD